MLLPTESILNKINSKKGRKLKILTCPTHEGYQSYLAQTGHEFYMLQGEGIKTWDFHTRPLPPNHFIINRPFPQFFPGYIDFDLVLSQERFGQIQRFKEIAQKLDIPHVHIDHTLPLKQWNERMVKQVSELRADKHVFITEFNKNSWMGRPEDKIIYHGLDPNFFTGWNGSGEYGISVVNHFAGRDVFCGWNIWQEVAKEIPVKLVGENPGLSESAKSPQDLVNQLADSRFFLNTSQWSPIPLSLIEAMMVGCPIITSSKQEIPKFIRHGVNGFIADSPEEIIEYSKVLLNNIELAKELSYNVRQTALKFFSSDRFVQEWNEIFNSVI